MARWSAVALVAAGCGVSVGSGGDTTDAPGLRPIDASIDSPIPIDARACTGGDQSMIGPDGSCFLLFAAPKTFADAKAMCEANSSHLAILTTAPVDTFAEQFVGTLDTWIGLDDQLVENTFVWVDGTPLGFTNWHTGEPNDSGGEDCAVIAGARIDKQWDDRPCVPRADGVGGLYASLCQF